MTLKVLISGATHFCSVGESFAIRAGAAVAAVAPSAASASPHPRPVRRIRIGFSLAPVVQPKLVVCLLDHEPVVGGADDRGPGVTGEPAEQKRDREGVRPVEARGRLVGEQEPRTRGDGPRDRDAGPLALREPGHALAGPLGEPDRLECGVRAPAAARRCRGA